MQKKSESVISQHKQLREFFTVKELAERWRLSERHVRRITDAGELPIHRMGRSVRISADNVLLYEARCAGVLKGHRLT